jgi:hypothetical protein
MSASVIPCGSDNHAVKRGSMVLEGNTLYVVEALRWGDRENHSYVIGVFTTREQAELAGEVEVSWRANKYEYHISEYMLDFIPADKLFHHKGVVPDA